MHYHHAVEYVYRRMQLAFFTNPRQGQRCTTVHCFRFVETRLMVLILPKVVLQASATQTMDGYIELFAYFGVSILLNDSFLAA